MSVQRPPTLDSPPVVGETLKFIQDPLTLVSDLRDECGPVARMNVVGLGNVYALAGPTGFEQVLVEKRDAFRKSAGFRVAFRDGILSVEGGQWERQREALEEFFYPAKIRSYVDRMVELTARRLDRWTVGDQLPLHEEMRGMAMDNFFGTVFDRPLDPDGDEQLRHAASDLNLWFKSTSFALPNWVPTPARRRFSKAIETLETEAQRLLHERARNPGDDLLSALVELREEDGASLSEQEIVDQVLTLTFAGHDTTAVLLTYALHQLGQHDSVRERVHDELATQLGGEAPTLTDVQDLPVTRRVINETLRAYPPIHTIPRETVRSVEIEGYQLAPNTRTHLHTWALHRDPEHWEAPNEWRPSRWQDSTPSDRGFTFAPFGAGPRACLGRRFARLEATLVLAIIGQQYHLEPQRDLSYEPMSTLQPTDEVPVTVHER